MNIQIKKIFLISAIIMAGLALFIPNISLAQSATTVYTPNELEASGAAPSANVSIVRNLKTFGQDTGMTSADPRLIVARLVRIAMGFVGIIVLIMILGSGLMFMTSGGDEEKTSQAKRTFFNAIIGLLIMLSAYSIVTFVLNAITTASNPSNTTSTVPVAPDPIVNP